MILSSSSAVTSEGREPTPVSLLANSSDPATEEDIVARLSGRTGTHNHHLTPSLPLTSSQHNDLHTLTRQGGCRSSYHCTTCNARLPRQRQRTKGRTHKMRKIQTRLQWEITSNHWWFKTKRHQCNHIYCLLHSMTVFHIHLFVCLLANLLRFYFFNTTQL